MDLQESEASEGARERLEPLMDHETGSLSGGSASDCEEASVAGSARRPARRKAAQAAAPAAAAPAAPPPRLQLRVGAKRKATAELSRLQADWDAKAARLRVQSSSSSR